MCLGDRPGRSEPRACFSSPRDTGEPVSLPCRLGAHLRPSQPHPCSPKGRGGCGWHQRLNCFPLQSWFNHIPRLSRNRPGLGHLSAPGGSRPGVPKRQHLEATFAMLVKHTEHLCH